MRGDSCCSCASCMHDQVQSGRLSQSTSLVPDIACLLLHECLSACLQSGRLSDDCHVQHAYCTHCTSSCLVRKKRIPFIYSIHPQCLLHSQSLVACLLSGQEEGKQHGHAYVSGLAAGHGLPVPLPVPGRVPQLRPRECQLELVSVQPMPMLCMQPFITWLS